VTLGAYIQQELGINERVFVTAGVRSDNNSAFGRDLEAVYYPQVGVSWLISEEPFLPRSALLSSLRLRAAYGASGVSPGALDALLRYSAFPAVESGREVPGLQFQALGNPALRPERTTEFETGFDAGFLGGRIGLEFTYYNKHSRDALVARPLPLSLGVVSASRFENLGSVRNRGFEALLSAQILAEADFGWDVQVSGSRNSNRLVELGEGITPITASFRIRTVPGFPLFGFWDRPILSFEDANDDGMIEASELVMGDTAVFIGSSIPTREASLNSTLRLLRDRVRIGTQLDYRGGFVQLNVTEWFRCTSTNNCRAANDPSAPLDRQAAAVAARTPALGSSMEGYMEDGSFLRFREASLTVVLPGGLSRTLRASNASVTVSGRNLGIITGYSGPDPEVTHAQAFESQPFDMFMVPQNRYWLIRMNLGF
jgi:hypothetical protein